MGKKVKTIILIIVAIILMIITVQIKIMEIKGLITRENMIGELLFWLCSTMGYTLFMETGVAIIIYTIFRNRIIAKD